MSARTRVGGDLWQGDVKRYLRTNLGAYRGEVFMVTVTAPGSDVLPTAEAIASWNLTGRRRWSRLHRAAATAVRKNRGRLDVLAVVWQVQKRGALHVHVVLGYSLAAAPGAWDYRCELKRLAHRYGFGYVDGRNRGDGSTVMESGRAAHYLSKYLGESSQLGGALRLVVRPVYVARPLTQATGCTMRRLRRVRFLWHIRRGSSTVLAQAGRLPRWFRDTRELQLVQALVVAPAGP